jgi:hypothetical protein
MLVLVEAIFACDVNQIIGRVETDWMFDMIQIVVRVFRLLSVPVSRPHGSGCGALQLSWQTLPYPGNCCCCFMQAILLLLAKVAAQYLQQAITPRPGATWAAHLRCVPDFVLVVALVLELELAKQLWAEHGEFNAGGLAIIIITKYFELEPSSMLWRCFPCVQASGGGLATTWFQFCDR